MELAFSSNKMHYIKKCFNEVRYQEEISETIVPDSFPDVASIADCFASVFLRGKECRTGSAVISGALKAGAIYNPEDGTYPRLLEFYIPFSIRYDSPQIPESSEIVATLKVCSIDTRVINSRKVMLRANIGCEITVYSSETLMQYHVQKNDNRLQLKNTKTVVILPVETAEKSFVVGDTVEIPVSRPPVVQICKTTCRIENTDQKLIGNKAIFKGVLHCKFLYQSENNSMYVWSQELPYSQYCELQGDYDEGHLKFIPVITGCDVDLDTSNPSNSITLTANLLMQCIVSSAFELEMAEDAYCINGEMKPEWYQFVLECRLDHQKLPLQMRCVLPGSMQEIIDAELYDSYPVCRIDDQKTVVSTPVFVRVLGLDENGTALSMHGRSDLNAEYAMSENACCSMQLYQAEDYNAQNTGTGTEVRCRYQADSDFTAMQRFRTLCGGTMEDDSSENGRKPSVVMKHVQSEQSLWDIAKSYGTTVHAIQFANGIDAEYTQECTTLLIPMV